MTNLFTNKNQQIIFLYIIMIFKNNNFYQVRRFKYKFVKALKIIFQVNTLKVKIF